MKNLFFTTIIICLFLVSCGSAKKKLTDLVESEITEITETIETTETALDYNDDLIAIQSEVDNAIVDFLDVIKTFDPVEMETSRTETLDIIKNAMEDHTSFDIPLLADVKYGSIWGYGKKVNDTNIENFITCPVKPRPSGRGYKGQKM